MDIVRTNKNNRAYNAFENINTNSSQYQDSPSPNPRRVHESIDEPNQNKTPTYA